MPALPNVRHERFVRHYLRTGIAARAYKAAGYEVTTRNALDVCASQLLRRPKVKSRISELQRQMTQKTKISLESLLNDLAEDRALARSLGQASAAIQATVTAAKLVGLMVERKEAGAPGDFASLASVDEIVAKVRSELGEDAAARLVEVVDKSEPTPEAQPQGPLN